MNNSTYSGSDFCVLKSKKAMNYDSCNILAISWFCSAKRCGAPLEIDMDFFAAEIMHDLGRNISKHLNSNAVA